MDRGRTYYENQGIYLDYSEERRRREAIAFNAWRRGDRFEEIAEHMGVTTTTVRKWVRRQTEYRSGLGRWIASATKRRDVELGIWSDWRRGRSMKLIMRRWGYSFGTIRKIVLRREMDDGMSPEIRRLRHENKRPRSSTG